MHNDRDYIEDTEIKDDNSEAETENGYRFEVSSYGWDVDVEGLVKRLNREDIYVPGFQRGFVWSNAEKSRFIESLILGLPVPTIFLAKDSETSKLNIIDGQQRLKTLQSYLNGEFSLSGVDIPQDLKNKYHSKRRDTYNKRAKIIDQSDERTLSDAVIHAVVIKPNPKHDDKELGKEYNAAIIQIFKRLNTSGKALTSQEVRASIFHGNLLTTIQNINNYEDWRALFGNVHSRMKDQEAILRAIALYKNGSNYKASMPKFLDAFISDNRNIPQEECRNIEIIFKSSVSMIRESLGDSALKTGGTFIITRFDALVVSLMSILGDKIYKDIQEATDQAKEILGKQSIKEKLQNLHKDTRGLDDKGEEISSIPDNQKGYLWSVDKFTNDTNRVSVRLRVSLEEFLKK
ncbi:DUF262 domain-containing protein [Gluconobacter cerinus]|uniref:GmrSD restriction endonucleases N-terminal domain-containing protein n=1 Tax=Gluconobacter cerinus TaxID=38307 RepID=A0AAV5NFB1_9PROT|nr:DUF262 domain-containing protein [Gluconobacter cerinus]GBQ98676.1 hypothetical protein AA0229_0774 [Gluconobacter cerinus NRIC 0229]GLQ62961.1 hypothetical protein GCM10007867_18060 [Gluconobacter cerinus]